jgi:protein gp37
MKKNKILWTEAAANFVAGFTSGLNGHEFQYNYRNKVSYAMNPASIFKTRDNEFAQAYDLMNPMRIITSSWSDLFSEEADHSRADIWEVIRKTPQYNWQILTSRPGRISKCLPRDWGDGWENVWLGISIENQADLFLANWLAEVPAENRFMSIEPLLGKIDLSRSQTLIEKFNWCVISGKLGMVTRDNHFRKCKIAWVEKIIKDLSGSTMNVFMKEVGSSTAFEVWLESYHYSDVINLASNIKLGSFPERKIENYILGL